MSETLQHNSNQFWQLLSAVCDDVASPRELSALEDLLCRDPAARQTYLQYIELHGTLFWDAANLPADLATCQCTAECHCPSAMLSQPSPDDSATAKTTTVTLTQPDAPPQVKDRRAARWLSASVAACMVCWGIFQFVPRPVPTPSQPAQLTTVDQDGGAETTVVNEHGDVAHHRDQNDGRGTPANGTNSSRHNRGQRIAADGNTNRKIDERQLVNLPRVDEDDTGNSQSHVADGTPTNTNSHSKPSVAIASSDEAIVQLINTQLAESWESAGVPVASRAKDTELLRRVTLDVAGHIPSPAAVRRYLANRSTQRYQQLVEELLDDAAYGRHQATVWTNLLVGRSKQRDVNYEALHRFLRRQFAENRSWQDTVASLISAEGSAGENGASSFLLAHLNNQAVPATAVTARLFLCTQVQCAQCHDYSPQQRSQSEFWALNSFFKQTAVVKRRSRDRQTGQLKTEEVLVSRPVGGATFFENREGVLQAAYPMFAGVKIPDDPSVNRRQVLADLLSQGERPQIARAFINRVWAQLFGRGFTTPVDDMGPHNPPSHPLLLDRLTEEFVASGYDVKRLLRWLLLSDAYQLSTAQPNRDSVDERELSLADELFARQTIRPMSVEQLYDSLLVASQADHASAGNWEQVARQRREWLQQFITIFETEENDEAETFQGTISQALAMMNSELTTRAISDRPGTFLSKVLRQSGSDIDKVRALCLAALSRYPTSRELAAARLLLRNRAAGRPLTEDMRREALQDIFWAYLNSNEFILVH